MRFEAKHSYFKCLSESMGNFINLPYSLSVRHQEYQCYLHTNNKELKEVSGDVDNINVGPVLQVYSTHRSSTGVPRRRRCKQPLTRKAT